MKKYSINEMMLIEYGFKKIAYTAFRIGATYDVNDIYCESEIIYKGCYEMLQDYIKRIFGLDEYDFISRFDSDFCFSYSSDTMYYRKFLSYMRAFNNYMKEYKKTNVGKSISLP